MPPEDEFEVAIKKKIAEDTEKGPTMKDAAEIFNATLAEHFTEAELAAMTHAEQKQAVYQILYGGGKPAVTVPKAEYNYNSHGYKSVVNTNFTYLFGTTVPLLDNNEFTVFVDVKNGTHLWGKGKKGGVMNVWEALDKTHEPGDSPKQGDTQLGIDGPQMWFSGGWHTMEPQVSPAQKTVNNKNYKLFQGIGRVYVVADCVPDVKPWGLLKKTVPFWWDTSTGKIYKHVEGQGWIGAGGEGHVYGEPVPAIAIPGSLYMGYEGILEQFSGGTWNTLKEIHEEKTDEKETKEVEVPEKKVAVELRKYDGGKEVPRVYYVGDVAPKKVPAEGDKKIYWVNTKTNKINKWHEGEWIDAHYYKVRDKVGDPDADDGDVVLGQGQLTVFKWGKWTELKSVPMDGGQVPEAEPIVAEDAPVEKAFINPIAANVEKWYHNKSTSLFYVAPFDPQHVKDTAYGVGTSIKVHWVDTKAKKVWLRDNEGKWAASPRKLFISKDASGLVNEGDLWVSNGAVKVSHAGAFVATMKEHVTDTCLLKVPENMMADPFPHVTAMSKLVKGFSVAGLTDGTVKMHKLAGEVIEYYLAPFDPTDYVGIGEGTKYFAQYWVNTESATMWYWHPKGMKWNSCMGMYNVYTDPNKATAALGNILLSDGKISTGKDGSFKAMDEYDVDPKHLGLVNIAIPAAEVEKYTTEDYGWVYYVADKDPHGTLVKTNKQGVFWINKKNGGFFFTHDNGEKWSDKPNKYVTNDDTVLFQYDVLHTDDKFLVHTKYKGGIVCEKTALDEGELYSAEEAVPAEPETEILYVTYKKPDTNFVYFVGKGNPHAAAKGSGHFWVDTENKKIYRWLVKTGWDWQVPNTVWKSIVGTKSKFKSGDVCVPDGLDKGAYVYVSGQFKFMQKGTTVKAKAEPKVAAAEVEPAPPFVESVVERYHGATQRPYFFANSGPDNAYAGERHHWVNLMAKKVWRWSIITNEWIMKNNTVSITTGNLPTVAIGGDICITPKDYFGCKNGEWQQLSTPAKSAKKMKTVLFEGEGDKYTKTKVYISTEEPDKSLKYTKGYYTFWANPVTGEVFEMISWNDKWEKQSYKAGYDLYKEEGAKAYWVSVADDHSVVTQFDGTDWEYLSKVDEAVAEEPKVAVEKPKTAMFKGTFAGSKPTLVYVSTDEPDPSVTFTQGHFTFWANPETGLMHEFLKFGGWNATHWKAKYDNGGAEALNFWVNASKDHKCAEQYWSGQWHTMQLVGTAIPEPKVVAPKLTTLFKGSFGGPKETRVYVSVEEPDGSIDYKVEYYTFWANPKTGVVHELSYSGWHTTSYKEVKYGTFTGGGDYWINASDDHTKATQYYNGKWHGLQYVGSAIPEPKAVAGLDKYAGEVDGIHVEYFVGAAEPEGVAFDAKFIKLWANPDTGEIRQKMLNSWSLNKGQTVGKHLSDDVEPWSLSLMNHKDNGAFVKWSGDEWKPLKKVETGAVEAEVKAVPAAPKVYKGKLFGGSKEVKVVVGTGEIPDGLREGDETLWVDTETEKVTGIYANDIKKPLNWVKVFHGAQKPTGNYYNIKIVGDALAVEDSTGWVILAEQVEEAVTPVKHFKAKTGIKNFYIGEGEPDKSIPKSGITLWIDPVAGKMWEKTGSWHKVQYKAGYNLHLSDEEVHSWYVSISPDHSKAWFHYKGLWSELIDMDTSVIFAKIATEVNEAKKAAAAAGEAVKEFGAAVSEWADAQTAEFSGKVLVGSGTHYTAHVTVSALPEPITKPEWKKEEVNFWVNPATGTVWEYMGYGGGTWTDHSKLYPAGFNLTAEGAPKKNWVISVGDECKSVFIGMKETGGWTQLAPKAGKSVTDLTKEAVAMMQKPLVVEPKPKVFTGQMYSANTVKVILGVGEPSGKLWEEGVDTMYIDTSAKDAWWVGEQEFSKLWHVTYKTEDYGGSAWDVKYVDGKLYMMKSGAWKEFKPETVTPAVPEPESEAVIWWGIKGLQGYSRAYCISDVEPTKDSFPMYSQVYWIDPVSNTIFRRLSDGKWSAVKGAQYYNGTGVPMYPALNSIKLKDGKAWIWVSEQKWAALDKVVKHKGKGGGELHIPAEVVNSAKAETNTVGKPVLIYEFKGNKYYVGTPEQRFEMGAMPQGGGTSYWVDTEALVLLAWKSYKPEWELVDDVKVYPTAEGKSKAGHISWTFCLDGTTLWAHNTSGWHELLPVGPKGPKGGVKLGEAIVTTTPNNWAKKIMFKDTAFNITYGGGKSEHFEYLADDTAKAEKVWNHFMTDPKTAKLAGDGTVYAEAVKKYVAGVDPAAPDAMVWGEAVEGNSIYAKTIKKNSVPNPVIGVDLIKNGYIDNAMVVSGGWSVPKGQAYGIDDLAAGPKPKGSVLDHKDGKDVSAHATGTLLEAGDIVMVGVKPFVGKIVKVEKVVYFTHEQKYYISFKWDGQWVSILPGDVVLLEKVKKNAEPAW